MDGFFKFKVLHIHPNLMITRNLIYVKHFLDLNLKNVLQINFLFL
jgi:hypothetical protein